MIDFTLWDILRNLLLAARWTLALSLIAFIGGSLVGLALTFLRLTRWPGAALFCRLYTELFQGTPLLMQLFLAFFGVSVFGLDVSAWTAAAVALTLFSSAFLHDIWRGCVEAVPKGQWEGARVLGLGYLKTMRHIILPQALRMAIAPTVGFSVQIIKGTALASVIGFVELTKAGTMLNNATLEPFTVFALVALLYFAMCYPLSRLARHLEARLNVTAR
ncbi:MULTISPECIES: amino acid ABC transporter permease [unclassified Cobetia]|uniref:amino acid ABC transporter permease n=1 Tax=unclassified Cobetia TaxID=2609414 RepID=UPI0020980630|nr:MULTISPECIES: amino acid ABC transporter permease [unclassified Cobetia]MCO7233750.1 amino acid ABC transporter permease [Cobetia sp. Dlab-2-AX]MCO7237077.1 amino acid ABC transporter permease [Cobetia sp. Dlab-2-U]